MLIITRSLTAGDSIILLRRRVIGVEDGDVGVDFVNGGTSENRRIGFSEEVDRNNVLIFNLSIILTYVKERIIDLLLKSKTKVEMIMIE